MNCLEHSICISLVPSSLSYFLAELSSLLGGKEFFYTRSRLSFYFIEDTEKDKLCLEEKEIKQKSSRKQNGAKKNLLLITIKNQLSIWEYCTTLKCRFNSRHPSFRSWNPTIFNNIRLVAGSMRQTTHRPSIWCSKHYFFRYFLQTYALSM